MNKYLEKIASAIDYGVDGVDFDAEERDAKHLAGAGALVGGAVLARRQYDRGHLTGRETLYHGSSKDRISNIRATGLIPNLGGGVSELAGIGGKNKDLVFAEYRKANAKTYGLQQDAIDKGTFQLNDQLRRAILSAKGHIPFLHENNVVKINLPTWKPEYKKSLNPEIRYTFRRPGFRLQAAIRRMSEEAMRKSMVKTLQTNVHVQRGLGGIPTDYIHGSRNYRGNSAKEVMQYIKANPKRFSAGLGRALGGAAISAGGLALLTKAHKDQMGKG